jgi:hypothetical protein
VSADRQTRHVTDEELLLDFYGEGSASDRERAQAHLITCDDCRRLDRELRDVLSTVDTTPLTEPPDGFEREMWARIEPRLPVAGRGATSAAWPLPRLALAASVVALVVTAFAAGRSWDQPRSPAEPEIVLAPLMAERLLRAEVGDHLERSQRVLVELVNADIGADDVVTGDRVRAADLVAAGRLYRRSVEDLGDREIGGLLEDLERVLVEVANGSSGAGK